MGQLETAPAGGPESGRRREFFESVAPGWRDRGFTPDELPRVERLRERLGDLRGRAVLEPGCGAGRLSTLLSRWVGPEGRVTAIDNCPAMAAAAEQTVAGSCRGTVEVICQDVLDYAAASGSFDLVILFCVYPHLRDRPRALLHLRWLLRDGGRLVIAHLVGSARLNAIHAAAGEPVCHDTLPSAEELTATLGEAGFTVCSLIDSDDEFYLEAHAVG